MFILLRGGGGGAKFVKHTNRHTQGLDALMTALNSWNGGVIIVSHDERFITNVAKEVISVLVSAKCANCNGELSSGCARTRR